VGDRVECRDGARDGRRALGYAEPPLTDYRTRGTDPEGFDPRQVRQVRPEEWDLQLGWGTKTLSVRGIAIIIVLAVAVVVASSLYGAYQSDRQHAGLTRSQDQTSCILAMTADERTAFRKDMGPQVFERWCWWLRSR
jgi:hypothetical protein